MTQPDWLAALLGAPLPEEGGSIVAHGRQLTVIGGIPRVAGLHSPAQEQTARTFGFKWEQRASYEGEVTAHAGRWLVEKYGDLATASWLDEHGPSPIVLDAGCGAAMSALMLFAPVLNRIRYLGVDVSTAVEVAARRFAERGLKAAFLQADLMQLPLPSESIDIIFSEGALHHTDHTGLALAALTRHLKRDGRILFYVYRKKGPIREFTDDFVRAKLQAMTPEEAWAAIMPLTKLGRALGGLAVEIEVPERIDLLEIPAGRMSLQRFFYWHVCKAFYRPEMSLEELNHINFDWFVPKNAHRHTPEEVRGWCSALGLTIEHERIEEAGITIRARKAG